FDHLVGQDKQRRRDREAERLRGLRVDHKIELGRLLNGQIGGLGTLEDFVHISGGTPIQVWKMHSVGHESASYGKLTESIHRRQPVFDRKLNDPLSVTKRQRVNYDDQRLCLRSNHSGEGAFELIWVIY